MPTTDIIATLLKASEPVGIALAAFYFFNIISKRHTDSMKAIVDEGSNRLAEITKLYSRDSKAISVQFQKFVASNNELKETNKELKETLEKVYIQNVTLVKNQRMN